MSDRQVNLGLVNGNWNEPKPILRLGGLTITCSALTRVTLAHAHERSSTTLVYKCTRGLGDRHGIVIALYIYIYTDTNTLHLVFYIFISIYFMMDVILNYYYYYIISDPRYRL